MKGKIQIANAMRLLGSGLIASVAVYVYYGWFFPVSPFFFGDDWFVLPERVWFKNSWDWLTHILFLAQNRFTCVGDFMLYRPGIFVWMWIHDVLFRTDRLAVQILLMFATTSVLLAQLLITRKFVRWPLASIGCIYILAYPQHGLLYTWPHISGYMGALGFYACAVGVLFSEKKTRATYGQAGILFFLAELFQEFVSITVVLLLIWDALYWRRKDPKGFKARSITLTLSLLFFLVIIFSVYLKTRPPSLMSSYDSEHFHLTWEHFSNVLNLVIDVFDRIFRDTVPFPMDGPVTSAIGYVLGLIGIWILGKSILSLDKKRIPFFWSALLPAIAIVGGFSATRINTRGAISPWYYEMVRYFLVMAILVAWPISKKWNLKTYVLAFLLLTSSILSAFRGHIRNDERSMNSEMLIPLVREVASFFSRESGRCYSGMISSDFSSSLNQILNILLQRSTCGWQAGEPTYVKLSASQPPQSIDLKPLLSGDGWQSILLSLGPDIESDDLKSFLETAPYNYLEANRGLSHSGLINIRWSDDFKNIRQLRASFKSQDDFPRLYSVGVALRSLSHTKYFVLSNNHLLVFRSSGGQLELVTQTQVPEMRDQFSLQLVDVGNECFIFFYDFLLTRSDRCFSEPVKSGAITFDNASPQEQIELLEFK